MKWEVSSIDFYDDWFLSLKEKYQSKIDAHVMLLEDHGPNLKFPYSSGIYDSKHDHMRELRVQIKGDPYRILYAFDSNREAILLLGGNKGGNKRWYDENIPIADGLYDNHLIDIKTRK